MNLKNLTALERILLPLLISLFVSIVAYKNCQLNWLTWFSITFAVLSKILDACAINSLKAGVEFAKQGVYKDYAIQAIEQISNNITRADHINIHIFLQRLEDTLNDIWRCCPTGSTMKNQFWNNKGLIGDIKTTTQKALIDTNLSIDYRSLLENLQKIRTDLKEM